MKILSIALRNIFRNFKRSILTIMIFVLAVGFIIIGLGWVNGVFNNLIYEGVKITGNIRISAKDYDLKEKTMELDSNVDEKILDEKVKNITNVKAAFGKIKFGGILIKNDNSQKEGLGYGIEKEEFEIVDFNKYIYSGRSLNFSNNEREIIVGEKIEKYLKLKIGDIITLLTKTQYNSMSAYNYKIVGFYSLDNRKLNQSFYVKLKDAQELLDMNGLVNEYLIFCNYDDTFTLKKQIKEIFSEYNIKSWEEIGVNGTLLNMIPIVKFILIVIFGVLAGVGIANTMLMVGFERKKEIGVMKAIGVSNNEILSILLIEGIMLGFLGSMLGILFGGGLVLILSKTGIKIDALEEGMPSGVMLKGIIYPQIDFKTVAIAFGAGILVSVLATLISCLSIIKKEPVKLIY